MRHHWWGGEDLALGMECAASLVGWRGPGSRRDIHRSQRGVASVEKAAALPGRNIQNRNNLLSGGSEMPLHQLTTRLWYTPHGGHRMIT